MWNLIREGSLTALVFTFDNNVINYFVLFQIPADSALVFEVELLKIERKEELWWGHIIGVTWYLLVVLWLWFLIAHNIFSEYYLFTW